MHLKAVIKKIANEKHISAQLVLQNYMLERFLERISLSEYNDRFIIKGGFLIASMVGIASRTTMDMDASVKRIPLTAEMIQAMIENIISIPVNDNITFRLQRISTIRENNDYLGYRAALSADYGKMAVPIKLDISTGDIITPSETDYSYPLLLEERTIHVLAYNLETILAEKLHAVLSWGVQSTRLRDYYDIFILTTLRSDRIDIPVLKTALDATFVQRGDSEAIRNYPALLLTIRNSSVMLQRWKDYARNNEYSAKIPFSDVCSAIKTILDKVYSRK